MTAESFYQKHQQSIHFVTTKSQGVLGTHVINLRRIKGASIMKALSDFEQRTPGLVIQSPNH